jgi:thiamine-monophosphate kinase
MVSEFEFIEKLRQKYSLKAIGDDCAVLPKDEKTDQVITADLLVEDIDFLLEWTKPEFLGHKALAVSLSDIAAMGAEPNWAMLSLGIPKNIWNSGFVDKFFEGWHKLARKYGVELVGGDISRTPDKMIIDSIVGGEVPKGKAILRSGARPGDAIFVTGELGGAVGGLELMENGSRLDTADQFQVVLLSRQLKPEPQLSIAKLLQNHYVVSSMIDISDGLSSDLAHICEESRVGAKIDADLIPVDPSLIQQFGSEEAFDLALTGGEDFELLFTTNEKIFSVPQSIKISRIGEITANTGIIELVRDGNTEILTPRGYRHF